VTSIPSPPAAHFPPTQLLTGPLFVPPQVAGVRKRRVSSPPAGVLVFRRRMAIMAPGTWRRQYFHVVMLLLLLSMLSIMDHGSDGCASERLLANDDGGNVDDCTAWCSARCGAASTPIARGMIKMKSVCSIGSLSMFDERVSQSLRVQAESNVSQKSNQIKDSSFSSIQTTNNVYYLSATKQSFKKKNQTSQSSGPSPTLRADTIKTKLERAEDKFGRSSISYKHSFRRQVPMRLTIALLCGQSRRKALQCETAPVPKGSTQHECDYRSTIATWSRLRSSIECIRMYACLWWSTETPEGPKRMDLVSQVEGFSKAVRMDLISCSGFGGNGCLRPGET
jgi:hypothetical protein